MTCSRTGMAKYPIFPRWGMPCISVKLYATSSLQDAVGEAMPGRFPDQGERRLQLKQHTGGELKCS